MDTDLLETVWARPNPSEYWWYPPAVNYQYMEQEDWAMPDWFLEEEELHQVLDPAELEQQADRLLVQDEPYYSDKLFGSAEEELNVTVTELSPQAKSDLAVLQRLARNPSNPAQVNLSRVVNLEQVQTTQQRASPSPSKRRSARKKNKPRRFDDEYY